MNKLVSYQSPSIHAPVIQVVNDYTEPPVGLYKTGSFKVVGSLVGQISIKPYGVLWRKEWDHGAAVFSPYLAARPFGGWQVISGLADKKGRPCVLVTFDTRAARDLYLETFPESLCVEVLGPSGTGVPP